MNILRYILWKQSFTWILTVCLLSSALATGDKQDLLEEREKRFKCAEHAFLCTMRSWSGLCQMCQSRQIGNLKYVLYFKFIRYQLDLLHEINCFFIFPGPSHLQAVVDILYLNNNEVRVSSEHYKINKYGKYSSHFFWKCCVVMGF